MFSLPREAWNGHRKGQPWHSPGRRCRWHFGDSQNSQIFLGRADSHPNNSRCSEVVPARARGLKFPELPEVPAPGGSRSLAGRVPPPHFGSESRDCRNPELEAPARIRIPAQTPKKCHPVPVPVPTLAASAMSPFPAEPAPCPSTLWGKKPLPKPKKPS